MNRLRDEAGDGPISEKGLDLIRRTPGTAAMPEMRRRVWARLQESAPGRAMPRRFGLRAFAAAAVVLGLGGSAGAMIAQRWLGRVAPPAPAQTPARVVAVSAPRTGVRAATPAPAPLADLSPSPIGAPAGKVHSPRTAPQRVIDLTPAAAPAAERTQVLDAMVALRRDHDAARAGRLLDQYLGAHPRGALREEALVLAIEAAAARGDGPATRRLAASYADAYPNGRFHAFARDTLGAGNP